jgi:pimeloyl-ACP methyl ester carboxylesterase
MPELKIQGTELHYTDRGSGEPVVLVHGSASDRRTWQLQEEAFAENFRVISFSRRYHWPNAPISEAAEYSMAEHVADLQQLLQALDAEPAHLVGHSYGAFLCLLLAVHDPSLVRTLVLAEPPAITLFVSSTPRPPELLKLLVTRPRTAAAVIRFGAKGVGPACEAFRKGDLLEGVRIFGDAVFGPGGYDRLPEARKEQVHENIGNVRAELLGPGFLPLEAESLRRLDLPTLLLTAERSIALFHRLADRVEELLPDVERVQIPGASHMMHEDNPEAYNRAVVQFLEQHCGTSADASATRSHERG